MLAVADADPDDFDEAVRRLLLTDLKAFPTPYQLRQAIKSARTARLLRARALFGGAARVAAPAPTPWLEVLAGLGATPEDVRWWQDTARQHGLPSGLARGLFVPPRPDRHACLFVRTDTDVTNWQMPWRASTRRAIAAEMAHRYGLLRDLACVALPDALGEDTLRLLAG